MFVLEFKLVMKLFVHEIVHKFVGEINNVILKDVSNV